MVRIESQLEEKPEDPKSHKEDLIKKAIILKEKIKEEERQLVEEKRLQLLMFVLK